MPTESCDDWVIEIAGLSYTPNIKKRKGMQGSSNNLFSQLLTERPKLSDIMLCHLQVFHLYYIAGVAKGALKTIDSQLGR